MVKESWVSDAVQLEFAENWDWNNKIQAKREALTANSMVFLFKLGLQELSIQHTYRRSSQTED